MVCPYLTPDQSARPQQAIALPGVWLPLFVRAFLPTPRPPGAGRSRQLLLGGVGEGVQREERHVDCADLPAAGQDNVTYWKRKRNQQLSSEYKLRK